MRIAQVCPRYYPYIGGVETHVRQVSERLAKKGFEMEVLATVQSKKLPAKEVINGVVVKRFNSWAPREAYYISNELRKYLDENSGNYDIVHAHNYHALPALYAALAKSKNRLLFTPHYHGSGHTFFRSLLHIPYRHLGKTIFNKADKVICVSHYERNLVLEDFDLAEEKVVVVPNGVDLEEFKGLKKNVKNRRNLLSVGRLEKYKGLQHLIRVLPRLNDDVTLDIVGKGPYKENLIRLARRLGVYDRVKFFQDLPRTELLQKYADADVFLLLSEHEAYGLCVAEALCAGAPCIVANASALREWVDDEACFGIDCPINLDKLVCLINNVIGKGVKKLKVLDWNEVTMEIISLYEQT